MKNLFWLAFSCVKGVGDKTVIELYRQHPYIDFDLVRNEEFLKILPQKFIKFLTVEALQEGERRAKALIEIHEQKGIEVIPINSGKYPIALRMIDDPPAVLYAKGNVSLLERLDMVAIIGTREPTEIGILSGRRIAATFAEMGYVVVSGLALGIDTAGHEGALRVTDGKTIAVMAGDLTTVYPAKNKPLVQEILKKDGLLISETPIGKANTRGNFVKRDRIQSGLSLGVCPVQTPIKSGTQHTIQFSREQKRLLFTPTVLPADLQENAVQGNLELLQEKGVMELKNKESYVEIVKKMNEVKVRILQEDTVIHTKKKLEIKTSPLCEQVKLF